MRLPRDLLHRLMNWKALASDDNAPIRVLAAGAEIFGELALRLKRGEIALAVKNGKSF